MRLPSLPMIPVLEVGANFPEATLRAESARAHALLDAATHGVPAAALKVLDGISRRWLAKAHNGHLAEEKTAILSGGELTVTVRGSGSGGPNQEYALGLAIALEATPGICALAGDTDGTDGGGGNPDDPAGAMVFPDTLPRSAAADLNAATFLANNNSTAYFRALGDLVQCGPTQTNVNDFRVILVDP